METEIVLARIQKILQILNNFELPSSVKNKNNNKNFDKTQNLFWFSTFYLKNKFSEA